MRGNTTLWIAAAALVGFLIGFLLQYARVNRAQDALASADRSLQAARVESMLSAAVIEAQSGRYEEARQRASDFYTGLQRRLLPVIPEAQRADARTILSERDSIITSLARNDPTSAGTLTSVLIRVRETVRRAGLDSSMTMTTAAPDSGKL